MTGYITGMTRAERMAVDNFIQVIGFVDEDGKLVSGVLDRFQSRFAYLHGPSGTMHISVTPLANQGITKFSIRDAVIFGFSTVEYLDLLEWERQSSHYIQNEDELTALYDSALRNDLPYP
ncbi:hypothetical protein HRR99_06985 [Agrobacterium vaccinii]|uniref:hypothetical protein n=1 Tax=Agrobacterium vaccinii TaxID=2735528 RepID=UPI001E538F48|nr:hypothetical protein [Agrobacterium vaccinii]UHS61274.1 hypothetical protein HRR99_06985 [Agrobacterium vaccinii]